MLAPDESAILAVQSGKLSHLLIGVSPASLQKVCVLPGSFNPLHDGHQRMAEIAVARTGRELVFELCLQNVDKPPLSVEETQKRLQQSFSPNSVVLTGGPTFQEKAALFGGATFVVGADTVQRIADPRYYDNDAKKRDQAITTIRQAGCQFLVFGRCFSAARSDRDSIGNKPTNSFRSLKELTLTEDLQSICKEVPQSEFDFPISSTEIRNRQVPPPTE